MSSVNKQWEDKIRRGGLRRFALAITALNVLGHAWFGFEQSFAQPVLAVLAAYATELLLETVDALANRRPARFLGGPMCLVDFLLSAHITGLACAMLLYANARVLPVVFAAIAAIASKSLFRVTVGSRSRHFLNPSNIGITATLLLFPWVGIAPPYQFTENLDIPGDLLLPGIIVVSGSLLNVFFTRRVPLILSWLVGFGAQAALRSVIFDSPLTIELLPMTGVAFILYTFYMVTDPATTPDRTSSQVLFGLSVAATYGLLMTLHIVFGLFFALAIVCVARGCSLYLAEFAREHAKVPERMRSAPAGAGS